MRVLRASLGEAILRNAIDSGGDNNISFNIAYNMNHLMRVWRIIS